MTLTLAWVRSVGETEELVVATDSRLRPFGWDTAPKILPLPRGDSVLAFAGDTQFAYPVMQQMMHTVESWDPAASRTQPLAELKGHLLRVLDRMSMPKEYADLPNSEVPAPTAVFLLAGFCWSSQRFRIWKLHYQSDIDRFSFHAYRRWSGNNSAKMLAVAGNHMHEAKRLIRKQLDSVDRLRSGGIDMEPLQVLGQMIDNDRFLEIGGRIQLVKIYRSLKTVPFVVSKDDEKSLFGRPLLSYEAPDRFPELKID